MKFKKLIVLLLFLGILLVLGVFKKFETHKDAVLERKTPTLSSVWPSAVGATFVTRVTVRRGNDEDKQIVIQKSGEDWVLKSYWDAPARKSTLDTMLKDIVELKGELRSESGDVLADYALLDEEAYHVILGAEDRELSHLLIGSGGAGVRENFVRAAGSDRVFVTSPILTLFNIWSKDDALQSKSFADLKVLKPDASKVSKFVLREKTGGRAITFTKNEKADKSGFEWAVEPKPAHALDETKITAYLGALSNLYAAEALDPSGSDYGFNEEEPALHLEETEGAETRSSDVFLGRRDASKNTTVLKTLPSARVYEVSDASLDSILRKDRSNFTQPPSS